MSYLPGIHEPDQSAAALWGDKPGTVVFTEAIGSNPNNKSGGDYRWWSDRGFRVLVRLNNGYFPDGTIPGPSLYESFAQRCAAFVAASQGCNHWIVGNEPNHSQERPQGQTIRATDYARCFALCREAIKRVNSNHQVLVAGVAPWNEQSGDWLAYWRIVLDAIAGKGGADGLSIHAYTHGADPALVASEHKVNSWYWHFRTYRDQLAAVPASMRHLPVDITEANQGDEAWVDANTGWVQAAMREIDAWNKVPGNQTIRSVVLYRWPDFDKWGIKNKAGVQDDFREACKQGYAVPGATVQAAPEQTYMPSVQRGSQRVVGLPEREISEDFKRRVPLLLFAKPEYMDAYYRLIKAEYVPDGARRFGPDHHILVEVLDAQGNRKMGVPVHFYWGNGETVVNTNKQGGPYAADYGMTSAGQSFGVWVGDVPALSDGVFGMGLGKIGSEHMGDHVTYYLVFQEAIEGLDDKPQAQPQPTQPATVATLVHPIENPALRVISQVFGVNPQRYQKWGLAGHNGVDYAVPVDTPIRAVDDGVVAEALIDIDGYGIYTKVIHTWGESLYAHLSRWAVDNGQRVQRGQVVGFSGNSGNSTGPHLHLGLRVNPYTRGAPFDGYSDPLPYLKQGPFVPSQPSPEPVSHAPVRESYLPWFRQYGEQYAVEWYILAALAFYENKYQTEPISHKGALGLMQFTPDTWADMQVQLGVTDPLDPEQSIKAAAFYLSVIRRYLGKQGKHGWSWVLAGYNAGMGFVSQAEWEQVPPETQKYVDNILHLSIALRRWEEVW